MGPCSCDRKRPPLSSRLGRRLGRVVQLQVSKFGSWKYCWPVCTREVGPRKAKVRDFSDTFTDPHTVLSFTSFFNGPNGYVC
jgi:hypothetical protein